MDFNFESFPKFFRLCFFKFCSHIFMIFEVNWSSDFGQAETGSEEKKRVVLWREFFLLQFYSRVRKRRSN